MSPPADWRRPLPSSKSPHARGVTACASSSPASAHFPARRSIRARRWSRRSPAGAAQPSPASSARPCLCHRLCRGRSRSAQAPRAKAGHRPDVRPCRSPTRALRRDPCPQRCFGAVSGRRRLSREARRDRRRRAVLALTATHRSRAFSARRGPAPSHAAVARCRPLSLQLHLLAGLGTLRDGAPLVQFIHIPRVRIAPRRPSNAGGLRLRSLSVPPKGYSPRSLPRTPLTLPARTAACPDAEQPSGTPFDACDPGDAHDHKSP